MSCLTGLVEILGVGPFYCVDSLEISIPERIRSSGSVVYQNAFRGIKIGFDARMQTGR